MDNHEWHTISEIRDELTEIAERVKELSDRLDECTATGLRGARALTSAASLKRSRAINVLEMRPGAATSRITAKPMHRRCRVSRMATAISGGT